VPHPPTPGREPTPADPADPGVSPAAIEPLPRRAARILVIDGNGRVLLFHGCDPARRSHHYWFTPGGGLDPGESPAQGAARELAEETGLRVPPQDLGQPVWDQVTTFPFDGQWYRQEQQFFALRVAAWQVDTAGFDQIERDYIDGHRWWSVAELESTDDRVYPVEIAEVVRRVLTVREASTC
jgi:8-oxo-dGTP pyrophosphatase MutT (NUDIX family)